MENEQEPYHLSRVSVRFGGCNVVWLFVRFEGLNRHCVPVFPSQVWCNLFLGSLETLADILPVHNIPDGLNIVRSNILVLEIVCMLPNIYPK